MLEQEESGPEYYFRLRDHGATVFRLKGENRYRRLEMQEIATIYTESGHIDAFHDTHLDAKDEAAIQNWLEQRREYLTQRQNAEIRSLAERVNMVAHWAKNVVEPELLDEVTEPLLLAVNDLREVLVRKMVERLIDQADEDNQV